MGITRAGCWKETADEIPTGECAYSTIPDQKAKEGEGNSGGSIASREVSTGNKVSIFFGC